MIHISRVIASEEPALQAHYGEKGTAFSERVIAKDGKVVRVQTERRDGLVFMRAKKRILYKSA